jgi:hypothetical protein
VLRFPRDAIDPIGHQQAAVLTIPAVGGAGEGASNAAASMEDSAAGWPSTSAAGASD